MKIRLTLEANRALDAYGDRLGPARPQRKTLLNAILHVYSFEKPHICSPQGIDFLHRLPYPTGNPYDLSSDAEALLKELHDHILATGSAGREVNQEEVAIYLVLLAAREHEKCWISVRDFVLSKIKPHPTQIYLELSDDELKFAAVSANNVQPKKPIAERLAFRLDELVASKTDAQLQALVNGILSRHIPPSRSKLVVLSLQEDTKRRLTGVIPSRFEDTLSCVIRNELLPASS